MNQRVVANTCVACEPGSTNEPGDDATGENTTCDVALCGENEYVSGNQCQACGAGLVNTAGDNPTGADTRCEHPCDANAAAESERIMSLPREADRYICCVPEVNRFGGMLDCEEVTYAEKPTATCDDEAEAAVS